MIGSFTRTVLGGFGALASPALLALQRGRGGGVVLLYHRVSEQRDPSYDPLRPDIFRRHCEILRSRYQVLSLADFVARAGAGDILTGCCAITFDDGYRDFLDNAYPALEAHGLPATHFLVSDCVRTGKPNWNLRLKHVTRRRAPDAAAAMREEARLVEELGRLAAPDRYAWLDAAEAGTTIDAPAMLSAEDLQRVSPELIEWGSHTASHAMLSATPETGARVELERSRVEIEEMSGRPVRFLSYPNSSYSPKTTELARACGYAAAFAVEQREVRAGESLFALPRVDVGTLPPAMLIAETTGFIEALRRVRGREAAA